MRYILLILGLALGSASCSKNGLAKEAGGSVPDTKVALNYMDVSYGADAQQTMDVYLPENRNEKTRLLLIIHGGGWTGGDKSDFSSYISEFKSRLPGYAFANLNYRLVTATTNHFPTQENDILSAVQFLKDKAKDYSISNEFVYLGISAGAHLALLQGYKHNGVLQPKGIVSFFGPVDLEQLYLQSDSTIPWVLKTIIGSTLEENPRLFTESSPINYVASNSAPTLMLHGEKDMLVPVQQAYMLRDKLTSAGVTNQLFVYPGQGHGWVGKDLADSFSKVEAFIKGL